MGDVGILAVLDDLHPVAAAVQVVMADQPRLLRVALRPHLAQFRTVCLHIYEQLSFTNPKPCLTIFHPE